MNRVLSFARGRAGRVGLVAGVAVASLVGLAVPAYAHHAVVSGTTYCSDGAHVIQWTIGNSQSNESMTIDNASAAIGSTPYSVSGYSSSIPGNGTTSATSTVPGSQSGTITLTVYSSWNNYSTVNSTSVVIPKPCCGCTTTTTAPTTTTEATTTTYETTTSKPTTTTEATTTTYETTTSMPTTTTWATTTTTKPHHHETTTSSTEVHGATTIVTNTTKPHSTTSVHEAGSTVPSTDAPTTPPIATGTLPRTGSGTGGVVLFGLSCIIAGGLMLLRKRNGLSRA